MMKRLIPWAFVLLLLCGAAITANATTFPAVTLDDLIARADVIFVGDVVDVRPFAVSTPDGPIIKTRVIFRVSDAWWGTSSVQEVLDFLGGQLNGVGMAVADMPTFKVGDRRVVFARRDQSINPIVGFTQGLLLVARDSDGVERVLTADGRALTLPEQVGNNIQSNRTASANAAATVKLADFRDHVRRSVARRQK